MYGGPSALAAAGLPVTGVRAPLPPFGQQNNFAVGLVEQAVELLGIDAV